MQRPRVVLYGDQALLELGARRATHLDQLVGPYSRNGFHHLGPVVFYLLGPFVRIFASGGPGLYLGAVAINATALVAAVAVVWQRLGPLAALWGAAAIELFCICLGVGTLREPWNPYLVIAPMILFIVLWAAGLTRSPTSVVWALVVGSYEAQTHIATAPLVITMSAVLLVDVVWLDRRPRRASSTTRRRWSTGRAAGVVALAAIWLAPVVELWRDHPDNLRLLWDFFTSPPAAAPLGHALQASADAMTIVPFGNHDYVLALNRGPIEVAVAAALVAIVSVAALRIGGRRHEPMSRALVASTVLGVVIGTVSLTRSDGPVVSYFAMWLAYVPLSALLALGAALFGPAGTTASPTPSPAPRVGWPVIAMCLVAVVLAATTVTSDLSMGPVNTTTGSGPWPHGLAATSQGKELTVHNTLALTRAAEGVLRRDDRLVGLTIGSSSVWPYASGIVLGLDQRGVQSTVAPAGWDVYFGHERAPGRAVTVAFFLYPSTARVQGTVIAQFDGVVLTYTRGGS